MAGFLGDNMPVITVDETKTLLRITNSNRDDLIEMLIPLIEGDINNYCNQTFVLWPAWMKLPASKMIAFQMEYSASAMSSESQGGYSYTKSDMANGYPIGIMHSFDSVRILSVKYAQKQTQFRDLRGMTSHQLNTITPPEFIPDLPL